MKGYRERAGSEDSAVGLPLLMPLSTANAQVAQAREAARPRKPGRSPVPRPLTEEASVGYSGNRYSLAQRIQALTLLAEGFTWQAVQEKTGMTQRTQSDLKKKAFARGFDPVVSPRILESYVIDGDRSGRPVEITDEVKAGLIANVVRDRAGREKSSDILAYEAGVSTTSALSILQDFGLNSVKVSRKPGLTKAQRAARLQWCLDHQHWTLEEWKKVIWTDETAVLLGHRRGSTRVWRSVHEIYDPTVVRPRWKGFSEFMFWGCFSYDYKGPCHIYETETAVMKTKATKWLEQENASREELGKAEWELEYSLRRVNLRRQPAGRQAVWRFTEKTGKLIRKGKGGVDFYRYCEEVVKPKLIPFARECSRKEDTQFIIQQDNAPAHIHHYTSRVFQKSNISQMIWPANSPDLNAIEKSWPWLKRTTTVRGCPPSKKKLAKTWNKHWDDIDQNQIRKWIEAIPHHIQEIIRLEGGNEYKEGRDIKRGYKGQRRVGVLSTHSYLHQELSLQNESTVSDDEEEE
jgi:hypothetical protein